MAQRETLMDVQIITDDDCGMYRMGEIDTVVDHTVKKYIDRYGEFAYTELLDFAASLMASARNGILSKRQFESSFPAEQTKRCNL